jgi:hypothetical protein
MSPLIKRYIVSTLETFIVTFLATFGMFLDQVASSGYLPTKELLISAGFASLVAGGKAVSKAIRESLASIGTQIESESITNQPK